jgi:hypothetical protein
MMNTSMSESGSKSQTANLHLQEVVRSARIQLYELRQQRVDLMKRIGTIKQILAGLANIFGDSVLSDELLAFLDRKPVSRQPGFTRACRTSLMESGVPLGTRQICELLRRRFPEILKRHKDPVASVSTVLNRLVDYGEARCALDGSGRRVWEWVSDKHHGSRDRIGSDDGQRASRAGAENSV